MFDVATSCSCSDPLALWFQPMGSCVLEACLCLRSFAHLRHGFPTHPSTSFLPLVFHDPSFLVRTRASSTSLDAPVHHLCWQPSLLLLLGRLSRPLRSTARVSRWDRLHVPSTCSHTSIRRVGMRRTRGDGAQRRRRDVVWRFRSSREPNPQKKKRKKKEEEEEEEEVASTLVAKKRRRRCAGAFRLRFHATADAQEGKKEEWREDVGAGMDTSVDGFDRRGTMRRSDEDETDASRRNVGTKACHDHATCMETLPCAFDACKWTKKRRIVCDAHRRWDGPRLAHTHTP